MNILKNSIITISVIMLIAFVCPLPFMHILNAGNGAGILVSLILLCYGIFFSNVNGFIGKLTHTAGGRILLVLTGALLLIVLIFVIITSAIMLKTAFFNKPKTETTVIVLGCQVKPSGPSRMLRERIDAAYKYLAENPDAKCILSGGQGPDEPVSEAKCMYDNLVKMGIDKERLYIEDKSTSTRENIIFSKKIIEENNLNPKITIITNEFHQYRACKIARSVGFEAYTVSALTVITLLPTYWVRELGGVLFEMFIPMT